MVLVHTFIFAVSNFIDVHVELVDFLSTYVLTTQTITLAKTQIMKFLAMSDTLRIYYTGLPCNLWTAAVASVFCAIVATCVLASITSSKLCGQDFELAYMQLSHVYLVSALDVMHVIKCTRLSPSLVGRAYERG